MHLLQHWFRHEPHLLHDGRAFKYWPHERRLVETLIYLYEVRGIRRTEDLYTLAEVEPLGPQHDPWAKLGGQLATGSGKTKMMSLIIAWAYLNAVLEGESKLGFGQHAILIAPNLFVKDRLLQDFAPPTGETSVFFSDPVVPPAFERDFNLKVYDPVSCPRTLD
jgi:type III restriction enzyme